SFRAAVLHCCAVRETARISVAAALTCDLCLVETQNLFGNSKVAIRQIDQGTVVEVALVDLGVVPVDDRDVRIVGPEELGGGSGAGYVDGNQMRPVEQRKLLI